ncbi:MAG: ATP-binding protein [bacterium]
MTSGLAASGRPGRTRGILLLLFLALTVAVIDVSQWFVLGRVRESLEEETGLRLTTVARAAIGEATEELLLRPDVAEDAFVRSTLRDVATRDDLDDVFLLGPDGETLWDAEAAELGASNPYLDVDAASFAKAVAGQAAASRTREVNGVSFKSAYAPVRDVDGTVGAVLGVAAGGGFLARLTPLERSLRLVSVGSAALVVFLGVVFFGLLRRLGATEAALARTETLSAMGMMAAGVAHEVRNPLAIIAGTAQRLRKKYGAGATDPLFDFIPEEVERLNGIVEGYLRFARDEPLRRVETDLVRVVDRSLRLVEDGAAAAGVRLVRAGLTGSLSLAADPQRLTQVLLNLLLNAVQAMPRGGEVRVDVAQEGAFGVVRVADSGSGFDERALRGAFQPFFTTKEKGSGLGLAMTKRIVEAHDGTIAVANRPEGGALVTVRLPLGMGALAREET